MLSEDTLLLLLYLFFFNDTATTEIYTLSLHDALPIPVRKAESTLASSLHRKASMPRASAACSSSRIDRKSTRLNSSHITISYAVFCLKKKNTTTQADSQRGKQPGAAQDRLSHYCAHTH